MKNIKKQSLLLLMRRSSIEIVLVLFVLIGFAYVLIPGSAFADFAFPSEEQRKNVALQIEAMENRTLPFGVLTASELAPPRVVGQMPVTAYNSVVWQTNDQPCIGAQGTNICDLYQAGENICAANFVPLGTLLEVEGLGTCVVRDRMNSRYHYRVDWYMYMDIQAARQWGLKTRTISVYPR